MPDSDWRNFSKAAEKNQGPIQHVLSEALAASRRVLEIGSGSGQHACAFARQLPHLLWQPSETSEFFSALAENLRRHGTDNLCPPVLLDVQAAAWPVTRIDAIFSANTLHIMPWQTVEAMFAGIGRTLDDSGLLCIYGAMRYKGAFTSASNEQFDRSLKQRDPRRGIRDFEAVDGLARQQGLILLVDRQMPSHNQLLIWQRQRTD